MFAKASNIFLLYPSVIHTPDRNPHKPSHQSIAMTDSTQYDSPVVIVGAGPVGMLLALRLAQLGASCLLAEQNEDTIKLPKMDVTNIRSMEILRFMGLADEFRQLGPKEELSDWVTPFTTGMGETGHHLFTWVS